MKSKVELLHGDCMEYMATLPDKAFDLAIVDPPYAWDSGNGFTSRVKKYGSTKFNENRPSSEYFSELIRVSRNQIIWGGNYFLDDLGDTKCMLAWDKHQPIRTYARCEMAWTSFRDRHSDIIDLPYYGFTGKDRDRCHPNQKPISLYEILLANYAKEGDRILDTHLGSGSSAIAAHYGGFEFVGIELDEDYYKAAVERFDRETEQISLF